MAAAFQGVLDGPVERSFHSQAVQQQEGEVVHARQRQLPQQQGQQQVQVAVAGRENALARGSPCAAHPV
ncbi:MAG: hypothetical protein H6990_01330 [Pseudomonadales bacterium]|nr:hypothetical protein [Pseudomonadales bacterium]